jgi:hypothetical protein
MRPGGVIRLFQLTPGAALDRRVIKELFMEAAKRFTEGDHHYLGQNQFRRSSFDLDTWEEYQVNYATGMGYVVPDYGHQIPGTGLEVLNDDAYFEGDLVWNANILCMGSAKRVYGWPVVDGQALWAGESCAEVDQLFDYAEGETDPTDPENEQSTNEFAQGTRLSLGAKCAVHGLNSRSYIGVLICSLGRFQINRASAQLRKQIR